MKYATAIYDLKTHRLIALLEGRDSKTLEDWLNNHKKVKMVAKDKEDKDNKLKKKNKVR